MKLPEVAYYGVRHHGPGSARNLLLALEEFRPDAVLVEMPEEATSSLKYISHKDLKPPVALLIFDPGDREKAAFFPFAGFSPEWQAIQYAHVNKVPIVALDLPYFAAMQLNEGQGTRDKGQRTRDEGQGTRDKGQRTEDEGHGTRDKGISPSPQPHRSTAPSPSPSLPHSTHLPLQIDRRDPLKTLALLSGMNDGERWWDQYIERGSLGAPVFEHVDELMTSLRESAGSESEQTLAREAWMRQQILRISEKGKKRIAVIAGAWHIPALKNWKGQEDSDQKLLSAIAKKVVPSSSKVKAGKKRIDQLSESPLKSTWIPWSYRRLSKDSGYGAGVKAPAWYDLLFHEKEPIDHWMVMAAHIFREEGRMSSTAEVLEGRKMASALAQLNEQAIPGLQELTDSVKTVMADGDEMWMERIYEKLVIGNKYGKVPLDLPDNPVRRDFEKELKACRLYSTWESREKQEKVLDLRKPTASRTSRLLHRLHILDIPWGVEIGWDGGSTGTFREVWMLRWDEDYERRLVQAGMYGNSIEEACLNYLLETCSEDASISLIAEYLERSIKAGLSSLPEMFFRYYQHAMTREDQVIELVNAYNRLSSAQRYGSVREIDREELDRLLSLTFPRIVAGLADGLLAITEEDAHEVWNSVKEMLQLAGLREEDRLPDLLNSLGKLPDSPMLTAYLAGALTALLQYEGRVSEETAIGWMSLRLTDREHPDEAALFIEGFLTGIGGRLWNEPHWLYGLDKYVRGMDQDVFERVLPVLRRAFSEYGKSERKKILQHLRSPKTEQKKTESKIRFHEERMKALFEKWGI